MKPKQGGSYQSSSTTASYSYGANGLRKSKSVGGKTTGFVWDRGNVAAEMTGSTITNMYNYGPDGLTEREKSNGEISIYLKNAHGDVTWISDEYGIPWSGISLMHLVIHRQKQNRRHLATAENTETQKAA